jgi:hypothetical protein
MRSRPGDPGGAQPGCGAGFRPRPLGAALGGAFGGAFKDLDAHLKDACERRDVPLRGLSPTDLELILKRTHIDGDSEAGYELRELSPIDTMQGPPPVLRKG